MSRNTTDAHTAKEWTRTRGELVAVGERASVIAQATTASTAEAATPTPGGGNGGRAAAGTQTIAGGPDEGCTHHRLTRTNEIADRFMGA